MKVSKLGFVGALVLAPMLANAADGSFMYIKRLPGFAPSGYQDVTGPQMVAVSPVSGSEQVSVSTGLSITFNETISKGTGDIVISHSGIEDARIDGSSGLVSVSGDVAQVSLGIYACAGNSLQR